jgi:hypothetical protein
MRAFLLGLLLACSVASAQDPGPSVDSDIGVTTPAEAYTVARLAALQAQVARLEARVEQLEQRKARPKRRARKRG